MSARFEAFLARLYVEADFRQAVRQDPAGTARHAGLSDSEVNAVQAIDWAGLELAAASIGHKRTHQTKRRRRWWEC